MLRKLSLRQKNSFLIKQKQRVKLQTENFCFCLRWKLNKTQAAQVSNIMQSSSTLIRISGSIPEGKKSALTNDCKIAYWEKSKQSKVFENKFGLLQLYRWESVGWRILREFFQFFQFFRKYFQHLNWKKKNYINTNISFPWKLVI